MLLCLIATSTLIGQAQIVINEISCSNRSGLLDAYWEYEDWIEIYNTTGAPVNLGTYYLTDKPNNLSKWQLPNINLAANDHVVFICSDRDLYDGTYFHTNFKITQMREEKIMLSDATLTPIDSFEIAWPTQMDHSHGRLADGLNFWGPFTNPTPNASNIGGYLWYAAKPVFSLAPGFYAGAQSVTITTPEPNAVVRYTTDGSEPNAGDPIAAGPITINTTTTVRAKTFSNDGTILPSFNETNTYFINVTHTVPTVAVSGDVNFLITGWGVGGEKVTAVEYFDENGVLQWEQEGEMRRHGNDSWAFTQRGMRFHTRDQYGYDHKIDHLLFPGKTPRTDFDVIIMKAAGSDNYPAHNYLGSAHLRDGWVQTVSQRAGMDLDERTFEHQVTYLNGNYWGVYEMRERIDRDYTYYYYDQSTFDVDMLEYWGGLTIEYGTNVGWQNLYNWIVANDLSIPANYNYVLTQLDKENFIDYFIINTHFVNSDWLNWNTKWWRGNKPPGVPWRYTLWDMDNICDLGQNYTGWATTGVNANTVCDVQNMFSGWGSNVGHPTIYAKLLENEDFFWDYINRYSDLLNTGLHCDTLTAIMDEFENAMLPEMPAHFNRWGGNMATWQSNIDDILDFGCQRWSIVNQQIVDCFDDDYPITLPEDLVLIIVGNGTVDVNTVNIGATPWNASYFGGTTINFEAVPGLNAAFDHWEIANNYAGQNLLADTTWIDFAQADTVWAYFVDVSVLPVELLDFRGQPKDGDVLLDWTTESEINSQHFEVQRSIGDAGFYHIGTVQGAGNSVSTLQYQFTDHEPAIGTNYYRLKLVDLDGSYEYSNTIAVEFNGDQWPPFELYPSPASNNTALYNLTGSELEVQISSSGGKHMGIYTLAKRNVRQLDISTWRPGVYYLTTTLNGRRHHEKLVVLR